MSTHMPTSFSNAALLDALGLQAKRSATNRIFSTVGLVAAGVVVGAAAGMLLAPRSGRQLRQDLRVSAKELGDTVTATAATAVDAVKRKGQEARNHGEAAPLGYGDTAPLI